MTVTLAFIFFVCGTLFVSLGRPFGPLDPGAPTFLGVMVFAAAAPLFLFRQPVTVRLSVTHPRRYLVVSLVLLAATMAWLVLIVRRFGPSATLYVLRGEIPPISVLNGQYRAQLPLRAFWPPLLLADAVSMLLVTEAQRRLRLIPIAIVPLLAFVAIYETRHLLIWLVLYYLLHKVMYLKDVRRLFNARLLLPFAIGLVAFIAIGNIRTGIGFTEAKTFGEAMAVAPPYTNLPLGVLWALIYAFSSLARGIANDAYIAPVAWSLPEKLFPGAIQRTGIFAGSVPMSPRFAEQTFTIDAWHTYALSFGIVGAFALMAIIVLSLHVASSYVRRRIREGPYGAGPWLYALLLWMLVRAALLPIGDYYLDFGAIVELVSLGLLLRIAGLRVMAAAPRPSDLGSV